MKNLSHITLALALFAASSMNAMNEGYLPKLQTDDQNTTNEPLNIRPAKLGVSKKAGFVATLSAKKDAGLNWLGDTTVGRDLRYAWYMPTSFVQNHPYKTAAYVVAALVVLTAAGKGVHSICKAVKAKLAAKNS